MVSKKIPHWQRNIDFAILHTAGTKILEGLVQTLEFEPGKVEHNFEAFKLYGNTSSASLYYTLNQLVRTKGLKKGQKLMFLGYGSGFFTRGAIMEVAKDAAN